MEFGDFGYSLAVSALAAFLLLLFGIGGYSPLFLLWLFALSQAGFFALAALRKSGIGSPLAECVFAGVVFLGFFASALSFSALSASLQLLAVPIMLCAPAAGGAARSFFGS